jgi:hypothetical protein
VFKEDIMECKTSDLLLAMRISDEDTTGKNHPDSI